MNRAVMTGQTRCMDVWTGMFYWWIFTGTVWCNCTSCTATCAYH